MSGVMSVLKMAGWSPICSLECENREFKAECVKLKH